MTVSEMKVGKGHLVLYILAAGPDSLEKGATMWSKPDEFLAVNPDPVALWEIFLLLACASQPAIEATYQPPCSHRHGLNH